MLALHLKSRPRTLEPIPAERMLTPSDVTFFSLLALIVRRGISVETRRRCGTHCTALEVAFIGAAALCTTANVKLMRVL